MSTWVDKHKPKCLDDVIMDADTRDMFKGYLEKGDICSMTLSGVAGIGKTTTARVLTDMLDNCDARYINASDENGIDTVRTKIRNIMDMQAIGGGLKVIILDEADGLTKDGQNCLRNMIETDLEDTRFILTCNDVSKVIDPITSRCPIINLSYTLKEATQRVFEILVEEGVDVAKHKNEALKLVKQHFPDMRSTIHAVERAFSTGKYVDLEAKVLTNGDTVIDYILENIKNHVSCRSYWLSMEGSFNNDYVKLGTMLMNRFEDPTMLLYLGEKNYQLNVVKDKEIGFYQMVLAVKMYSSK
jgi:replication factor C small subunit